MNPSKKFSLVGAIGSRPLWHPHGDCRMKQNYIIWDWNGTLLDDSAITAAITSMPSVTLATPARRSIIWTQLSSGRPAGSRTAYRLPRCSLQRFFWTLPCATRLVVLAKHLGSRYRIEGRLRKASARGASGSLAESDSGRTLLRLGQAGRQRRRCINTAFLF